MEELYSLSELKDNYYFEVLRESNYILDNIKESELQYKYRGYLSNLREIDEEVLKDAYMFYLLDGYDEFDEIIKSDYIREVTGIQSSGYVRQLERFIFPILDMRNNILGFVGYDYDSDYKYLINNAYYVDRYNMFYNMQNLYSAYDEDVCVVEEGVFDSLRLNEIGLKNNLALLGKRVSDFHRVILNRFKLVIFITDNDEEGLKASKYWGKGLDTKVARIYLNKREIVKKKVIDEEIVEYNTCVKDIDDALRGSSGKDFLELYKKIKNDSKSPFFSCKTYYY